MLSDFCSEPRSIDAFGLLSGAKIHYSIGGLLLHCGLGIPAALPGGPKGNPVDISDELAPLRGADDEYPQFGAKPRQAQRIRTCSLLLCNNSI